MSEALELAQHLSALVEQLRATGLSAVHGNIAETHALRSASRRAAMTVTCDHCSDVRVNGEPVRDVTEIATLVEAMSAHHLASIALRRFAEPPELVELARALASDPPFAEADAIWTELDRRLWSVVICRVGPGDLDSPADVHDAGMSVDSSELGSLLQADYPTSRELLGRIRTSTEEFADRGDVDGVARIVDGLVALELRVVDPRVSQLVRETIAALGTHAITRVVAPRIACGRGASGILTFLARSGEHGARAVFEHLIVSDSLAERRAYCDALAALPASVPVLRGALDHEAWYVVRNAASLLGKMGVVEADVRLVELLAHPDARVQTAAIQALASLETRIAFGAIQGVIRGGSRELKQIAASAWSAHVHGPRPSASPLMDALDMDRDVDVRLEIISALGRLGTADAVQRLVKIVSSTEGHSYSVCRCAALEALARARGDSVIPLLQSMQQDRDPAVVRTARRVLRTLRRRGLVRAASQLASARGR